MDNNDSYWYTCTDTIVIRDKKLSQSAKFVFAVLCTFLTAKKRECWPSNETVADAADMSISTVKRAYTELEKRGVIVRSARFNAGSQTSSSTRIVGHAASCYKEGTPATDRPQSTSEPHPSSPVSHKVKPMKLIYKDSYKGEAELPQEIDSQNRQILIDFENPEQSPNTEKTAQLEHDDTGNIEAPKQVSSEEKESHIGHEGKAYSDSWNYSLTRENKTPVRPNTSANCSNQESSHNPRETCTLDDVPYIMRSTAELLLLKTDRKGLMEKEISALRELAANQYPNRVQEEIRKACERFVRTGHSLQTLTFMYIASALRNQPTWGKKAKLKQAIKKPNPKSMTSAEIAQTQVDYTDEDMKRAEELLRAKLRERGYSTI